MNSRCTLRTHATVHSRSCLDVLFGPLSRKEQLVLPHLHSVGGTRHLGGFTLLHLGSKGKHRHL